MLPAYSIQGYVYDDISGEPVQGVSVSVGIRSAVSDSSGYYSLSDLVSGPYTLVATKPGYDFEPASNLVEIYYEDMPYYDIPAHLITYHIAGHITTSGDEGYSSEEVLISVTDPTGSRNGTTYTDENGDYTIELLPCVVNPPQQTCLLTVKVSKPGYYFATPTAHVTLSNADINNINFTGVYQPGWISGKVCRYGFRNKGDCMSVCLEDMRGVMVTGSRSDGSDEVSTYTDSDGFFRIGPFARGTTIELDPWLYGYESCETRSVYLNVAEKDIENDPLGVSFTDGVTTYRIEGYTRMAFTQACVGGVTVTLTDSNSNVIETTSFDDDINPGWYQFTGLPAGTYTLTASKPCLGLTPWSIGVTITNADATEKNFTARTQTYSIYGTVTEMGGSPVAGAALSLYRLNNHIASTVSNSSGQYSFNGLANGGYTITIDSGCVPVFGNMSAFISCASVERNFECQSGLCESKRQEAASRLSQLRKLPPIDKGSPQANNSDMDATADKNNPSALNLQPSARIEASVAEYLFYHCDHLGTVRMITDNSGAVVSRHDYEPFGVEIAPVVETANNTHQFTGHERDANTGYDYMHYRSYGSNIGRFMKPDNITGNPLNPQSWNLYSYVRGNPVNFNDPTGHQEARPSSTVNTSESGIAGSHEMQSWGGWNDSVSDTTSNLNHKLTLNSIRPAPAPGDSNFIGPVAPGTKINDPFSIIDKNGKTIGVTGPPGPPTAKGDTNDTGSVATAISNKMKDQGVVVQPTTESEILLGNFNGGDEAINLIWTSHSSGKALCAWLYGGAGISSGDVAGAINNAYSNEKLTGKLNVIFSGCNTSGFAGDVYNQISPQYRPLVTIVGSQGLLDYEILTPSYTLNYLVPAGGWVKYP